MMEKDLTLKGRKALRKWDNTLVTIRFEAYNKYFVITNDGGLTKDNKNEFIVINE